MIVIRPSNLKTYFECPKRWLLDTLQPVPKVSEQLIVGQCVHAMIESYLFNHYVNDRQRVFKYVCKELADIFEGTINKKLAQANINSATDYGSYAERILKAFVKSFDDSHISAREFEFSSEEKLSIKLSDNVYFSGSFDVLLKEKGKDSTVLWDIKTMASRQTLPAYLIQLSSYALLVKQNLKLDVAELGVIKIVKAKRMYCEFESTQDAAFIAFCIHSTEALVKFLATTLNEYLVTNNEYLFKANPNHWTCNASFCAHYNDCKERRENGE